MIRIAASSVAFVALIAAVSSQLPATASSPIENKAAGPVVAQCVNCHGLSGVSGNPIWPSIAGLDARYIEAQLNAFAKGKDGARKSTHAPQMYAISKQLTPEQREALARHFAQQKPPSWADRTEETKGRAIYQDGTDTIVSCASCHGADAAGIADLAAPRLAGQSARYIVSQLDAYASGARSDGNSGMGALSAAMTAEERRAVAHYLSAREGIQP